MTFIIAEVGSNWDEFKDLKDSCVAAKVAGADAVKFQCFSERSLYGYGNSRPSLPYEWLAKIAHHCEEIGIEFMCTAFDEETLPYVNKYVKRHKLASSEMRHVGLIDKLRQYKKPVYVSVGGHRFNDIQKTVNEFGDTRLTLLYCCNAYPSIHHDLRVIDRLSGSFNCGVGYSDHTIDTYTAFAAVRYHKASVVEKHVRLPHIVDGPDVGHSLVFDDFKVLVDRIRAPAKTPDHPSVGEADAAKFHNRRLVATQNINVGDALQFGRNIGAYRVRRESAKFMDPRDGEQVNDTRSVVGLTAGDAIGPGDFK